MPAFSIIFAISSHLQIRQLPHFEIGFDSKIPRRTSSTFIPAVRTWQWLLRPAPSAGPFFNLTYIGIGHNMPMFSFKSGNISIHGLPCVVTETKNQQTNNQNPKNGVDKRPAFLIRGILFFRLHAQTAGPRTGRREQQ